MWDALLSPERKFWNWFRRRVPTPAMLADLSLGDELQARLDALGLSGWEVAPPDNPAGRDIFALSVNSLEELPLVERVVAAAPDMAGWTVCAGKPKKAWERVFYWGRDRRLIDASGWTVALRRYPDGLYDVGLMFDDEIPEVELQQLLDFVVESEVGQLRALCTVAAIRRLDAPEASDRLTAFPLSELDRALRDDA
jgi:hypothetical protein